MGAAAASAYLLHGGAPVDPAVEALALVVPVIVWAVILLAPRLRNRRERPPSRPRTVDTYGDEPI